MTTAKSRVTGFQRFLSSRVGWILVLFHLCLLIYCFAQKGTIPADTSHDSFLANSTTSIIAGRGFHLAYESLLLKAIVLLDLPGLIVTGLISVPVAVLATKLFPRPSFYTESWKAAVILMVGTSIQWLLVGYGIEVLLKKRRYKPDSTFESQTD